MFTNRNQTMPIHSLQNDLSQLENQLLRFKLLMIQFAALKTSNIQSELNKKYANMFECLSNSMMNFCKKYDQQFKKIQNKLIQSISPSEKAKQSDVEEKYLVVIDKIKRLERSLLQTQLNQNKLIGAINSLMAKYQIYEQPAIIQNDQYLRNKISTSQVSSLITFQPHIPNNREFSLDKSKNSQQNLSKTIKRSQHNIYLFRQDTHNQICPSNIQQKQFVRTFSKPNNLNKISLRQVNGGINYQNRFLNNSNQISQRSSNSKDRANSVDKNEHRLKFMMNKLNV